MVIQTPQGRQINWEHVVVQSAPDTVMLRVVPTTRFT
jgi:hypothetical protein